MALSDRLSVHSAQSVNVKKWLNETAESAESYLIKKKKRLYAYLGLSGFVFTLFMSICFLPILAPIFWEIMFLTPTGIILAGVMFSCLTIGLSGFSDMWNHRAVTNEEMQLAQSNNRSFSLFSVGPIVLGVGLLTAFSLTIVFPVLAPFIWSITMLSTTSIMLFTGMYMNMHSGMSPIYLFAERLLGVLPLVEDLSFMNDNEEHENNEQVVKKNAQIKLPIPAGEIHAVDHQYLAAPGGHGPLFSTGAPKVSLSAPPVLPSSGQPFLRMDNHERHRHCSSTMQSSQGPSDSTTSSYVIVQDPNNNAQRTGLR